MTSSREIAHLFWTMFLFGIGVSTTLAHAPVAARDVTPRTLH